MRKTIIEIAWYTPLSRGKKKKNWKLPTISTPVCCPVCVQRDDTAWERRDNTLHVIALRRENKIHKIRSGSGGCILLKSTIPGKFRHAFVASSDETAREEARRIRGRPSGSRIRVGHFGVDKSSRTSVARFWASSAALRIPKFCV